MRMVPTIGSRAQHGMTNSVMIKLVAASCARESIADVYGADDRISRAG